MHSDLFGRRGIYGHMNCYVKRIEQQPKMTRAMIYNVNGLHSNTPPAYLHRKTPAIVISPIGVKESDV